MPITLNDNLGINAPKPTDNRYGYYASLPNALSALDVTVRYIGLTVGILVGSSIVEYWFKDGILDANLVIKLDLSNIEVEISNKVDKVTGMGLSHNDLTNALLLEIGRAHV